MPTTATLYPTASYWHIKGDASWSTARNAVSSDDVFPINPADVGIRSGYNFTRTYLSFNLSAIPGGSTIDSITISLKRLDGLVSSYSPIIAYAGNARVSRAVNEYGLYIDNISGKISLDVITLPDDRNYYTSRGFDLAVYPVSPGDVLSVGIIDPADFNNTDGVTSNFYLFDIDPAGNQPYIEVTYTAGSGYSKPVMGISNFTDLNGISSANIASVMGVI
jgi:hypothetical protein